MATPQTPLILYHHIQSAHLVGEDLGVRRGQILLMCRCACRSPKIPTHTSAFCNNPPGDSIAQILLLFQPISTELHAHTPSTFKIWVSKLTLSVFPLGSTDFISTSYQNLSKLSTQQGHLGITVGACVNGPRALVMHTWNKNKKAHILLVCFTSYTLELSGILSV